MEDGGEAQDYERETYEVWKKWSGSFERDITVARGQGTNLRLEGAFDVLWIGERSSRCVSCHAPRLHS